MKAKDGRATARRNEMRVLRALHRFGWLRTRDLAALVWTNWAPKPDGVPAWVPAVATPSGLRMAQRTLERLRERPWVLKGTGPDGAVVYVLAEAGARELQAVGVQAKSGKDLLRFRGGYFRHRLHSNAIATSAIVQGFRAATEREIAQGQWIGGRDGIAGKRPDVLVRSGSQAWWVEIERSRKNSKDYAALLRWLVAIRQDLLRPEGPELLGPDVRLAGIVFVCTPAFRARLSADLARLEGLADLYGPQDFLVWVLYEPDDIIFLNAR